jgi:hypothetical protein
MGAGGCQKSFDLAGDVADVVVAADHRLGRGDSGPA